MAGGPPAGELQKPETAPQLPESCVLHLSLSISISPEDNGFITPAMLTAVPTPDQSATAKPQRVLACVLCKQRKIKCDRKSPCANCVRAGAQCVAATLARQRRRRFPERELLERLRHYEGLLRQNNIKFEPLHTPAAEHASPSEDGTLDDAHAEGPVSGTEGRSREKTAVKSKTV